MFDPVQIGILAAQQSKEAKRAQRGRAGRNVKEPHMSKQLHAAGQPKMNTPGVMAFPRGRKV